MRVTGVLLSSALAIAAMCGCGSPPTEADVVAAVGQGDVQAAKRLLASGASANSTDNRGFSALCIAALNGDTAMAALLLEHNASLSTAGGNPEPLGLAIQTGSIETVRLLLKHGANANGRALKPAPIGLATSVEMAELLFKAGADPNGNSESEGDKPLILAVRRGQVEVVEFLLAHGAKVNAETAQGQTALHVACVSRSSVLLNDGRDGTAELVKALLKAGASANASDSRENTPLHYLARNTLAGAEAARALIDARADPKAVNGEGKTPLGVAITVGRVESDPVVKLFRRLTNDFTIPPKKLNPQTDDGGPGLPPGHARNTPE